MLYLQTEIISIIFSSLNCPALLASREHLGLKPISWIVKTIALKKGVYVSSNGQLINTFRVKFAGVLAM
jgi:hypothetical protein